MRILLAGLTTRAIAESARRAGCEIITVDYFGDLDQKRLCENVSLREEGRRYSAAAILEAASGLPYDAVAYTGGLENHPDVVAELAQGKALLGNGPETLRRVRDPEVLFPFLAARGFAHPCTLWPGSPLPRWGTWLRKPVRGGGGQGVRVWKGGRLESGHILQEFVPGRPASAAFVADGWRCAVIGWTEHLLRPGSFAYGGNILPLEGPSGAFGEVREIAEALTREFGLRGVNGFDFVLRDGRPVLLEVNPRYCASMELVERATGVPVFGLHRAACAGQMPAVAPPGGGFWGKAILYARGAVCVADSPAWLERGARDVPHPGEVIGKGRPICTVFAWGPTRQACRAALRAEMDLVWRDCRPRRGGPRPMRRGLASAGGARRRGRQPGRPGPP
jgi:hypothetical protein